MPGWSLGISINLNSSTSELDWATHTVPRVQRRRGAKLRRSGLFVETRHPPSITSSVGAAYFRHDSAPTELRIFFVRDSTKIPPLNGADKNAPITEPPPGLFLPPKILSLSLSEFAGRGQFRLEALEQSQPIAHERLRDGHSFLAIQRVEFLQRRAVVMAHPAAGDGARLA